MQNNEPISIKKSSILSFYEEFQTQHQDILFYDLIAFVLAAAETVVVYLLCSLIYHASTIESLIGRIPDTALPWFGSLMLSRGLLQPLNLLLFWFGFNFLTFRIWMFQRESKAFHQPFFSGIPTNEEGELVIDEKVRTLPLENIGKISKDYSGSLPLLVRRLEAGSRKLADEGDAGQVQTVMQSIAEIDSETLESRYTLVRYLVWLIPTIGFLGTVLGVGQAISGFTAYMSQIGQSAGDFQIQLQPILGKIAGQLGVAFDTTVLALVLSAILVALISIVQTREEELLLNIDEFCLRFFVSRIAVPDVGTKQMADMVNQACMLLTQAIPHQHEKSSVNDGTFSWRDLAGPIIAQTEEIKELCKLSKSIAILVERIQVVIESNKDDSNKTIQPSGTSKRIR